MLKITIFALVSVMYQPSTFTPLHLEDVVIDGNDIQSFSRAEDGDAVALKTADDGDVVALKTADDGDVVALKIAEMPPREAVA